MARFLLDTSVLIDFSRSIEPAYSLINALMQSNDEIGTCAIVIAEFLSGVAPGDHHVWQDLFDTLDDWPIERSVAQRAGVIDTHLPGGESLSRPQTR